MRRLICLAVLLVLALPGAALDRRSVTRAQVQIDKGQKALVREQFERAEKSFRKAIEIEPELPEPYLGLGSALVGQKMYEQAIEALAEAEQRYVSWQETQARLQTESRQEAKTAAQDMRYHDAAAPPAGSNQVRTGSILAKAERTERSTRERLADREWNTEDESPIPAQVHYMKGIAFLRSGHRAEGIEALETCVVSSPEHGLAHYNLAVVDFGAGRFDDASTHLEAAVAAGVEPNPTFVKDLERARSNAGS